VGRGGVSRIVLRAIAGLVLGFLLLPLVIIVPTSFSASAYMEFPPRELSLRWYRNYFVSRAWIEPTLLSVRVAVVTTILSTVVGTLAAFGLVRGRFRGRRVLEFFLLSPMIVPVIVFAIGCYFLFARLKLIDTPAALYLSHAIVATPLVVIIVGGALRTFDRTVEQAARSLGADYARSLWYVTIPLLRPAILSAAAFAFLTSFDEVVLAVFLGGPAATTLPKRMWDNVRHEIDPTITAVASILIAASIVVLVLAELLRRGATPISAGPDRESATMKRRRYETSMK
jgi:ABC-type spermidine/putrescine transport system permease subunit II